MQPIRFTIPGKPVGKARPRLGRYGTYTPEKTRAYETLVKWNFKLATKFKNFKPMEGAVKVTITAIFAVPKSYSKKKREEALFNLEYTHKPDIDNISKIILDALNGLAWLDDSQVSSLSVCKNFGEKDQVIIELEEIKQWEYQEG